MTPRKRVLSILEGQQPDQVPWFGDLSYWFLSLSATGKMPEHYRGDGEFQFHRDLGVGFYLQGYFPFRPEYDGVQIRHARQGHESVDTVDTPVGSVRQVRRYLPESFCEATVEHYVKDWRDLAVIRYWYEHTRYAPEYDLAQRRYDLIGDNGVVLCYMPKSPLMEMIVLLAGLETTTYLWMDAQEELDETLRVLTAKADEAAAIAVRSPAECLMIPENLSSEMIGKQWFERYLRPYEERWNARIEAAGKYSFIHMDGTLRGLIAEVASTGFRVMEALTPAPVGDIPMPELHSRVGNDQTILWGGLPGAYFSDAISDKEFDRFVAETLEVMTSAPRFVLGVADQVPPDAQPERVRRVSQLTERYGTY